MRIVLDTNSLFAFFWRGSLIKKLLIKGHNLISPEFALEELKKHRTEILTKAKLSSADFKELLKDLQSLVRFIPFEQYSEKIPEAFNILSEHPKDIDFLAVALKFDASLVSNDKELFKQSKIKIFDKSKLSFLL